MVIPFSFKLRRDGSEWVSGLIRVPFGLLGILKAGDIALFVTSGSYSADAKQAASGSNNFIRLIDGDEFIQMWQDYYDKMSDEDKNMLPLKRISFLGNNE